MKDGTRVRILDKYEYNGRFYGMTGVVVHSSGSPYFGGTKIAVQVDGIDNKRSKYNGYWFAAVRCKRIDEEPVTLPGRYVTVHVKELNKGPDAPSIECARFDEDSDIQKDSIAVMLDSNIMSLVCVTQVTDEICQPIPAGRQLIAKANFDAYNLRKDIETRSRVLELKIGERIKTIMEHDIYDIIAEQDPAMKQMLEEYNQIRAEIPSLIEEGGETS